MTAHRKDARPQTEGLMAAMDTTLELLDKVRQREAEAHITFERNKEKANQVARERMIALSSDPDVANSVDPRTGKSNEEWRKWMIEAKLEGDEEFMESIIKHNNAQEAYLHAQAELLGVSERIGTLRTEAILLSSLLRYEAGAAEE
jgi:hypothetical protein